MRYARCDRAGRLRTTDRSACRDSRDGQSSPRPRWRARSSTADSSSRPAYRRARRPDPRPPSAASRLSPRSPSWTRQGIAAIGDGTAQTIARDVVVDLRAESESLRRGDADMAATAASGEWLATLWNRIRDTSSAITVATYDVDTMRLNLRRSEGQGPPIVVAQLEGTRSASTFRSGGAQTVSRAEPAPFRRTLELALERRAVPHRSLEGRPAVRGRSRKLSGRGRNAGRHVVPGCRDSGRADLPARRIPLRRLERPDRDDGRRSLLARLRQRRLARPLRGERVRRVGLRRVRRERRAATERSVPKRGRPVRGREPSGRRRSPVAGQRLRRGRPRPRRPH